MKGNQMKAIEARKLSNKNEKWKVIRRQIDKGIKESAQNGESSSTQVFYDDHESKQVVESLKADGFKCKIHVNFDQRDGDNCYIYKVSW